MFNIIAEIQFIDNSNCFLYLSSNIYKKLGPSLPKVLKGLVVNTHEIVYFTANTAINHKLSGDTVGLSSLYASSLNLSPGDKIILSPLDSSPSLSQVTAYPLSDDDRQILEIASGEVEASLLNQLKIVWHKQCFPVWISPTITVRLVVDTIIPNVEFGSLEEDTELIIGDVKDSYRLINAPSKETSSAVTINSESEITSNEELSDYHSSSISSPLFKSIVCRLVPEQNESSPYNVTLSLNGCPDWLKKSEPGSVFLLTGYTDPYPKVYVTVSVEASSLEDIGPFKTLSSSLSVFNHLSLNSGSKVILSPIYQTPDDLTSLFITPCAQLKKKFSLNEIENMFRKQIATFCFKWGRCLLNSKGIFPLGDGTTVTVTLRPLNLEWAFVTLISLNNISVSVNTIETNSPLLNGITDDNNRKFQTSCLFKSLSSDVRMLLEHSLSLKAGVKKLPSFKNNFLLIGKHGSGKTHLSNHFLNAVSKFPYYVHFENIDCISLKGKRIENVGKIIGSHLNACKLNQPSVFLIENIEIVCGTFSPELEKSEASFHIQRVSQKVADILEAFTLDSSILMFATCANVNSVNSALFKRRGRSLFSTIIPIHPLTQIERKFLMESTILNRTLNSEDSIKDLDLEYYSSLTDSYVAADLIRFIEKAIFEATQKYDAFQSEPILTTNDLQKAYESSSSFMQNKLKVQKHYDVKLSDIGGLQNVKEKLMEIIVWPTKHGSLLNQCPLKKQTGVLLYGAPGSGKTIIARAIAHESNLNFITVKGPELMSKYIGESEEGVRRVFENAQAAKPSLLFFDEFESLAPRRGEEQTGVTDRVVNQLLTALDGVEPISGVIVVAASSRPDLIDPALLRSGRLSHHLFCSFPNKEDRYEILKKLSGAMDLSENVDLKIISELTEEFSGADLKGLLTTAQIQVLDKIVDSRPEADSEVISESVKREVKITQEDLYNALEQTKPSLSGRDRLHFASIYNMFSKGKILDVTKQRAIFA